MKRLQSPQMVKMAEELLPAYYEKLRSDARDSESGRQYLALIDLIDECDPKDEPLLWELLESNDDRIRSEAAKGILKIHEDPRKDIYQDLRKVIRNEERSEGSWGTNDTHFPLTCYVINYFEKTDFEVTKKRLLNDLLQDNDKLQDSGIWELIEKFDVLYQIEDIEEKLVPYIHVSPFVSDTILNTERVSRKFLHNYRRLLDHEDSEFRERGERILGILKDSGSVTKMAKRLFDENRLNEFVETNRDPERIRFILSVGELDSETETILAAFDTIGTKKAKQLLLRFGLVQYGHFPNLSRVYKIIEDHSVKYTDLILDEIVGWKNLDHLTTKEMGFLEMAKGCLEGKEPTKSQKVKIEEISKGQHRYLKTFARKVSRDVVC